MRRLCSLLGMPQHRFGSIHVVGTNGKTSVTLMAAALLEAHGVRSGAYISPHIREWRERIRLVGGGGREAEQPPFGVVPISEDAFVSALERAETSARIADRSAGEEGPVTQFELLTAAAFLAFAEAGVQVAVVEAGLGGRLDATNVIPSALTVLTSVGLDHTEWLGDTLEEIAAEKLAVLRDHTALLTGPLPEGVKRVAVDEARARNAAMHVAVGSGSGGYQGQNFALAEAAAGELATGFAAGPLAESELMRSIPGRAEVVGRDPLQIFDAAHNPDGARALAALLPELVGDQEDGRRPSVLRLFRATGRRTLRMFGRGHPSKVVCCLAVLAEKDAKGIVEALAPACSHFVCTQIPTEAIRGSGRPVGQSHSAEELAELCRGAGAEAESVADPLEAWGRTRELARQRGAAALAAGSHYLLSCIWTERPAPSF